MERQEQGIITTMFFDCLDADKLAIRVLSFVLTKWSEISLH